MVGKWRSPPHDPWFASRARILLQKKHDGAAYRKSAKVRTRLRGYYLLEREGDSDVRAKDTETGKVHP